MNSSERCPEPGACRSWTAHARYWRSCPGRVLTSAVFVLVFVLILVRPGSAQTIFKIATLAPEGSNWITALRAIDNEVREATGGAVGLKIYPGGVQGGEGAMIRRMRIGQLHGAGFAGTGLSQLFADVLALETPFTFGNYDEVDYVLEQMEDYYRRGFAEGGYAFMGWVEIGFVHLLSKRPIRGRQEMEGMKVWRMLEDPLTGVIFDRAGVNSVPLTIPDVLLGLQTNLIEVVYTSPAAAIVLQWFTRVKYVTDLPIAYAVGAFLIDHRAMDRLTDEQQQVLRDAARRHLKKQRAVSRADNVEALEVIVDQGLELVTPPQEEIEEFQLLVHEALPELLDTAFSRESFDLVRSHLSEFRHRPTVLNP